MGSCEVTEREGDRMFLPRQNFPGWLGEAGAAGLLDYALANEARFAPARLTGSMAPTTDPSVRASLVLDDLAAHRAPLEARIRATLPRLDPALGRLDGEPKAITLELVAHGDGAHFLPHLDTVTGPGAADRKGRRRFSLIYYLHRQPRGFTGGSLRFYSLSGDAWEDVEPRHDLMVAFPSWAMHSVERVEVASRAFADSRFALNIWIYD